MAVLPSGFALPALPYLVGMGLGVAIVAVALWRLAPPVTADTVLGLIPWMVLGSALHALFVIDAAPAALAPLFGAPAVYATVFIALGAGWIAATARTRDARSAARWLGLVGSVGVVLAVGAVVAAAPTIAPVWPVVGLVAGAVVAAGAWALLRRAVPRSEVTGAPGALVVFAHALDGLSTAIGVDVLGFGERTPLSRTIMDVAGVLPTAELLGVGWLFVVVKLAVAGVVVALFADFVEDDPRQAYLLLAVVAAVGLGPGVHNLLLYAVAA